MIKATKAQRHALKRVWLRLDDGTTYRQFRKTVEQGWDCLMVRFAGMWLGIEKDGYTHS